MNELHHRFRANNDGLVAGHLPELSQANPDWFGQCAETIDATILETGDSRVPFTAQSIAKPLILALADNIADTILNHVGVEPTGESFHSLLYPDGELHLKLNPFMNAGVMTTLDLIHGQDLEHRFSRFCDLLQQLICRPVALNHQALASRRSNDHTIVPSPTC